MSGPARSRILGALGVALLLAAAWLLLSTILPGGDAGGPPEAARPAAAAVAPATSGEGVDPESAPAPDATAPDPAQAIPPPVDLETADKERDLHGVVVDEQGNPVAGAALEVERTRPGRGWGDRPHLVPQPEPLRGRSATDGTFRFRLEWGEQADLKVRAEGFGEGTLYSCPAGVRLRVELARIGGGIEVLVRDGEGNPVEGATVSVGGSTLALRLASRREGRSDAAGRFVCDGLAPGQVRVLAKHPEFGDVAGVETTVPREGRTRTEFLLDRGRVVEGRVVDAATGSPVAGARVGRSRILDRAVETDANGRFAFRGWNEVPGWHFGGLHCVAPGYARGRLEVPPEGPVEFRLERGFRVEGRVVGADGRPVGNAVIAATGYTRPPPGGHRDDVDTIRRATDEAGRWVILDLRRDFDYEVSVEAAGRAELRATVPGPAEGADGVDAGDLVLPEGGRVEGVVLDAGGRPVTDVEVSLQGGGDTRVDDRGRFRIANARSGDQTLYVARPDAYVLLETTVAVPASGELRDLVLRLPLFGKIVVLVRDTEGRPLQGAEVYAYGEDDVDWKETDADGRAVLDQIKEEVVDVSAEVRGGRGRAILIRAYVEGVRPAGQEMTLVLEEGVSITGVVRGTDGAPAPGVSVWATCEGLDEDWFHASTGEGGEFDLLVTRGLYFDLMSQRAGDDGKVIEKGTVRQVSGPKEGVEIRLDPVSLVPAAEAR